MRTPAMTGADALGLLIVFPVLSGTLAIREVGRVLGLLRRRFLLLPSAVFLELFTCPSCEPRLRLNLPLQQLER
jgi:hypothetical protein